MLIRNILVVNFGLLALLASACEKKESNKKSAPQVNTADDQPAGDKPADDKPADDKPAGDKTPSILGVWSGCEEMDIPDSLGESYPVRAQIITFDLQANGKGDVKVQYMNDLDCKNPLAETHVQQYRDSIYKECMAVGTIETAECEAAADESAEELAKDFLKPDAFSMTYIASAPDAKGRGTLDVTSADDPSQPSVVSTFYTTYELAGSVFKYAGACERGDVEEGICSKVNAGDTPEDRVVIFDNALTLTKK